jgi:multiple sugar transport system substrate-binding protein
MRSTKRFWLIILPLLLALLLVACGGANEEATETPQSAEPTTAADTGGGDEGDTGGGEEMETVTLSMILVTPQERWDFLLEEAEKKFEEENPNVDIVVDAQFLPFADRLTQLRAAATAGTPLDIVSLDQPEVGDFASAGFTTDLTEWINRDMDGLSNYLPAHREATKYQGGWHAIWIFTDARLLWYFKDMAEEAGVDPATDMTTWDGYIDSCQKLDALNDDVEGCLLIGQPWVADWTMPYAWMQGGDLGFDVNPDLAAAQGAADPWIPTFDSDAWVGALQFTRDQVDAGIDPFTEHQFGQAFAAKRFATWLGGTWAYGVLQDAEGVDLSNVGLVGAFPTPSEDVDTATMAGGWSLAIPSTSEHPEMAWAFLRTMLDDDIMGQMQVRYGELPTQETIADQYADQFAEFWNQGGVDRWAELQSLAPHAYGRPSFPTWPQISSTITDMVQQVMFENADPQEAAATAQQTALSDVLGWPAGTTVELHDDADGSCEHADVDWLFGAVTPGQQAADGNGNGDVCSHVVLP